jgi:protein SCO1/2
VATVQRTLRLATLAVLLVVAGAGAYTLGTRLAPAPELAGTALQNPPVVGEAVLLDPEGREVTLLEAAGGARVTLVFFGFTRCPDVCPITLSRLAKVYRDLGEPDDVQVLMITVDPEHDTPDVVGRYAAAFHPSFVGLSGSNAQVAVAARSFYVGYADVGGGQFTHTEVVAVVDRDGRLRYVYGNDKVPRLETDLERLRRLL